MSWHAQDLLLDPNGPLQPLQVVSGTHLDINLTLLPPEPYNQASSAASTEAAAEPASGMYNLTAPGCDSINKDSARVGLVFKSWRVEGRGAAVLSFDWSTRCLVLDFDEPFPDAYNPHPEDTAERRRIGGKLHNYEPGETGASHHKCECGLHCKAGVSAQLHAMLPSLCVQQHQ